METNKYGYKISYKKQNKKKEHLYLVTNTLNSAEWQIQWYKRNSTLKNVEWNIKEIKTKLEYKKLWRGCPF